MIICKEKLERGYIKEMDRHFSRINIDNNNNIRDTANRNIFQINTSGNIKPRDLPRLAKYLATSA